MTEASSELAPPGTRQVLERGRPIGYVMAVGGALLFSVNGSVSKVTLASGLDALDLVLLRCAGAMFALLLLVLVVEPARLRVRNREWPLLLLYGVIGIALVQWLYFVAIARLPVGIALLLEFTAPLLVALWATFVQRKDLGRTVWLALALALLGLALVAEVWDGLTLDLVGVLAAAAAAVSLATYFVAGERAVASRDTLSLAFWAFVVATVFWSVAHPWWTIPWSELSVEVSLGGNLSAWSVPLWSLVAWIVLLGTVAPFLLVIGALRHVPATRAGIVGTIEPVLAGVVAFLWLGEVLSAIQVAGALVVIVGVSLAQLATSTPNPGSGKESEVSGEASPE
ncbi:MAG: EamA family transporter [Actinomycetes bacterium]